MNRPNQIFAGANNAKRREQESYIPYSRQIVAKNSYQLNLFDDIDSVVDHISLLAKLVLDKLDDRREQR